MIVRKQYIPKRYRNKKLVNTSASGGFIAGSSNSTFIPEHKELRGIVTITDILNEGATDIHLTKTVAESLLTTITNFNNWFESDNTGTAIKAKFWFCGPKSSFTRFELSNSKVLTGLSFMLFILIFFLPQHVALNHAP